MKTALCLLLLTTTVGCFDVEQVDPCAGTTPFLVDDFEDDDVLASPPFERWSCSGFNPDGNPQAVNDCGKISRDEENEAFMGDFTLTDVENELQEFTGASLSTSSTRTFDLGCYRAIGLSAKFVPGNPPPPAKYYVELTCQSATSGGTPGPYSVIREIDLTSSWLRFPLSLSNFRQPTWQTNALDGGEKACLARVDGVGLLLSTNLGDGDTGSGVLYIDDVLFE